jgi:hypothetical protein
VDNVDSGYMMIDECIGLDSDREENEAFVCPFCDE